MKIDARSLPHWTTVQWWAVCVSYALGMLVGTTLLWHSGFSFPTNAGNWADSDWASGIGSMTGTGVALWYGFRADRQHRRESRDVAMIVSADIVQRLYGPINSLHASKANYEFGHYPPQTAEEDDSRHALILDGLITITSDQAFDVPREALVALSPVPNHCAQRLARALSIIGLLRTRLKSLRSNSEWPLMNVARKRQALAPHFESLNEALELFAVSIRACEALIAHTPRPNGHELHGNGDPDED
jgi:hypothetical protein